MRSPLDILNDEELKRFEKFIISPFFNSSKKMILLFRYFKANKIVKKEELFLSLYPQEKYKDARLRRLFSDFTMLLEKFFGYVEMEKWNDDFVNIRTLEMLMEKQSYKRFDANYKQTTSRMNRKFIKDDSFYRNVAQMEILNYYVNGSVDGLLSSIENTNLQFIFSTLHRYRDLLLHELQNRAKTEFNIEFLDKIVEYIKKNTNEIKTNHPNLYIIYLTVMDMANGENTFYIDELIIYLQKHERKFNKERLGYYYNYIVSCYWLRINSGRKEFYAEALAIYKLMDIKGIYNVERYIPHHVFNNIVMVAATNNDYSWMEEFINSYKKRIEPAFSNDVYNLSMGRLQFYRNDFYGSLKYLNEISNKNPNYYINSRTLLASIKYELNDIKGVKYVIDSFRHYGKTSKNLVKQQILNINSTVKYFRFLVRVNKKGISEASRMKKSLDKEKNVVPNKDWFYKKLAEN